MPSHLIQLMERKLGEPFFQHQLEAIEQAEDRSGDEPLRMCLYHATGKGKSRTSLAAVVVAGWDRAVVVAPPVTHPAWRALADILGVTIFPISHAKFRMADWKHDPRAALIVDEFHLLGGHTGKGWKKLDAMAKGLKAPLIICSATPSYNDAERVYCVAHVMDPHSNKGGFISFLHRHCLTENNPFGQTPNVTGFQNFPDAEAFLASLPYVHYIEDEVIKQVDIVDVPLLLSVPTFFRGYGYDHRNHRLLASQMEERHTEKRMKLLTDDNELKDIVTEKLDELIAQADGKVIVYSDSSTIAVAVHIALNQFTNWRAVTVTGKSGPADRDYRMQEFLTKPVVDVLIGTATMATGFDGADKVCDTMIIVDDTTDAAKRQQLMGRILPRGGDTDISKKRFYRLTY